MPPIRTEVCVADLRQLDIVQRLLTLLNEPSASAGELARLIDAMPVLAARFHVRVVARAGDRASTSLAGLSYLGNRALELVLFGLLEDLTDLSADQAGIPAGGSVFPRVTTVNPPSK